MRLPNGFTPSVHCYSTKITMRLTPLALCVCASLGAIVGCQGSIDDGAPMSASGATASLAGAGTNPTPGGGAGGSGPGAPAGSGAPATTFGGTTSSGAGTAGAPVVGGTSAGGPPLSCTTPQTATSKRLVRLSFNQIASSIGGLIDTMLGSKVAADNQVVDAEHRTFPPLQNPQI